MCEVYAMWAVYDRTGKAVAVYQWKEEEMAREHAKRIGGYYHREKIPAT